MHTFKTLIPFFLTAGFAVNAETTSCVTSTRTFPTITTTIIEPTSIWSGNGTGSGPYTVYTTEYQMFCSTGLRVHTYTITEPCHEAKCKPHVTGVPPGFTTTVTVCNSCGPEPVTATLTVPCEATPTKGPSPPGKTNAPPKPQPEHCETCHAPEQPQPVPSAPSGKPVPTGSQPEGCTTCGAPQPPASMATSVAPNPSGEKPGLTPSGGSAPGKPTAVVAGAARTSYGELGLLGIFGLGFILLGFPL
ncbi:hypothetical protein FBEOM_202 [Fusarium beomiforme]|uniref:Uncharacterized protein n=1 Tax=Fusarium beomiforme TaxID=44412 RepID=A0A9P5AWF8_9HYPO|nr:hypothetical protein FBEOM_202 [Fusarium beomiforme]